MLNDHPHDARACQRAAYEWLTLARNAHNPQQKSQLLAVAEEWLQMAHDLFERERSTLH